MSRPTQNPHPPDAREIRTPLRQRIQDIRMILMDVDGTLTDGGLYYTAQGEFCKRFHVRDGMGVVLLRRAGFITGILTSDPSDIIAVRAQALSIDHVVRGSRNKTQALREISSTLALSLSEIAYVGDDINDEGPMRLCGVTACPSDAVTAIKRLADYHCLSAGGNGAVREFAEFLLMAHGKPITLTEDF